MIVAEGDLVIVHGRFSNFGLPVNWIEADIVRIKDGILAEHWDVIQDEAAEEQSKSGAHLAADRHCPDVTVLARSCRSTHSLRSVSIAARASTSAAPSRI
jgi:hypothetical protein